MTNKNKTRLKWFFYILTVYLLLILQTTVLARVRILGGTPVLVPFVIVTICLREESTTACALALIAGFLTDALTPGCNGFYTIAYVICAFLTCIISQFLFWKSFFITLACSVAFTLICDIFYAIIYMLILGRGSMLTLGMAIPGQLLATVIFTPLIYPIVCSVSRRFRIEGDS